MTQPEEASEELARLRMYRDIIERSVYGYIVTDLEGMVTFASSGMTKVNHFDPNELVGRNIADFIHPDDLGIAALAFAEVGREWGQRQGEGVPLALRIRDAHGGWCEVEAGARNQLDDAVGGVVVRIRPAGGEQGLARALEALMLDRPLEEVFGAVVDSLLDSLPGTRAVAVAFDWNGERFESVVADGDSGGVLGELCRQPDGPAPLVVARDSLVVVGREDLDERWRRELGRHGYESIWLQPARMQQTACIAVGRMFVGAPWTTHQVVLDRWLALVALTLERRQHDQRLRYEANHDHLTGLANGASFRSALGRLAASPPPHGWAILLVDLDGFKPVNDGHGHAAGDVVLQGVADRLRTVCRPDDVVARLGGDEFGVLCPGVGSEVVARDIAARFLDAMRRPIDVGGGSTAVVGASVGLVAVDGGTHDGAGVLDRADRLLYEAKRGGGNRVRSTTA